MRIWLQVAACVILQLLGAADALKDGKYVLKVKGGACDGKILAYPRYDKNYPGKVSLQSANATNPSLWEIKNVGTDMVTLQAVNRAKNYPGKLSYDKNCAKNPVFTAKSGAFKWDVVSSGSNFFLKPTHCAEGFELGISCEGKEVVVFEAGQRASIFTPLRVTATVVSLNCPSGCNVCAPCDSTKGLCVNAPKGTSCSGGTCNGQGECVPAGSCTPACSECQTCTGNKCVNSPVNTTCSAGLCDGQGSCKAAPPPPPQGCQSNSQCAAPTPICSSGKCVQCTGDYDCSSVILAPRCINNACSACPSGTYYESSACKPCSVCNGWFVFAGDCSALQDTQCTETIPQAPTIAIVPGQPLQVKVSWTAPPSATNILSYTVTCRSSTYGATRSATVTGSPPATEVIIGTDATGSNTALVANEVYTCRVFATNTEDQSRESAPSTSFIPESAKAIYTPDTNPHVVKVTWKPSQSTEIALKFTKYLIECTSFDGPLNTVTAEVLDISKGQATVYPVAAACTYDCAVYTITNDGTAASTTTNSFSTARLLPLGTGYDSEDEEITAIVPAPDGKKLYVAGYIFTMGGVSTYSVAEFDFLTNRWGRLSDTQLNDFCQVLAFGSDGNLYACGFFTNVGNKCAKWSPTTRAWSSIDTTGLKLNNAKEMAATADGALYLGGNIETPSPAIVKYDIKTDSWSVAGPGPWPFGLQSGVLTVAAGKDKAYAGGFSGGYYYDYSFTYISSPGFVQIDLDTADFIPVSPAIEGYLFDVAVGPDEMVYVVGGFIRAGGKSANYIASWDGSTWSNLGNGIPGEANTVVVASNKKVYTAVKTSGVSKIYAWDPTSKTWTTPITDIDEDVYKMASSGVHVFFSGPFTNVDGVTVNGIAKTSAL